MVLPDFFTLRASGALLAVSATSAAIAFSITPLAARAVPAPFAAIVLAVAPRDASATFTLLFSTCSPLPARSACSIHLFKVLPNSTFRFRNRAALERTMFELVL